MNLSPFSRELAPGGLRRCVPLILALLVGLGVTGASADITVNGLKSYQVIDGFGVNINHRSWTNNELAPVLDAFIDQAGMTLFRVIFDNTDWESTNDDPNPDVMNWDYYNQVYTNSEFQALWGIMHYLNQRGLTNGVMVNFQGPGPSWMGGTNLLSGYENEWAEMIASLFFYARNTEHLQFSLVDPNNEPDMYVTDNGANTSEGVMMDYNQYTNALHFLAEQFDNNGMSDVRFVGPDSVTEFGYLWEMMNDPLIVSKLGHVGLHSYTGGGEGSTNMYQTLQDSPLNGITFWMTEFNVWCYPCEWYGTNAYGWQDFRDTASYLLYHLANGASAGIVWEGYDSYYKILNNWSTWGLFAVSGQYDVPKTYTPRKNFYTVSQISKFVRPGARRIGITGVPGALQLLAFYHTGDGQLTLTGVNSDSNPADLSVRLSSLPALSNLDLYYTDADTNLAYGGSFVVSNQAFKASVPADCVFTLVAAGASKTSGASSTNSILDELAQARNEMLLAAAHYDALDRGSTLDCLNQALNALEAVRGDMISPAVQQALGRKMAPLSRKLASAEKAIARAQKLAQANDPAGLTRGRRKGIIGTFKVAADILFTGGTQIRKPWVAVASLGGGGFYRPAAAINFRIDQAGCGEIPQVTVLNLIDTQAVLPGTATLNSTNGKLTLMAGLQAGAASVQVVACGRTNIQFVFNGGFPPITGVPDWFPRRLRGGQYVITASGTATNSVYDSQTGWQSGPPQEIPDQVCGTVKFTGLRSFASQTMTDIQAGLDSISTVLGVSGCAENVTVTAFNSSSFVATYNLSCSSANSSTAATINFAVQRQP